MLANRFIPTRVGNTGNAYPSSVCITVHPHASGEHGDWGFLLASTSGSSPREWGTPGLRLLDLTIIRFIPTRVGNT